MFSGCWDCETEGGVAGGWRVFNWELCRVRGEVSLELCGLFSLHKLICNKGPAVYEHPIPSCSHTPLQHFYLWGHFHLPLLWSLSKLRHSFCSGHYRGDRAGSTQPCSRLYIVGQLWALHARGSSGGLAWWPKEWKQDQQDKCCPEKSKMPPTGRVHRKWFFLSEMH